MSEPTTAARSPRSNKHAKPQTKRPAPRKRGKKSAVKLPVRTLIVLALLLAAAITGLLTARASLRQLAREREEAAAQYERLVQRHTVAYRGWIERYAAENGIEPAYVAAVILRESSYDPNATSSVGARGLMQIMPDTFEQIRRGLGEAGATFDDMYDPETNIRYGCWYLGYLSRIFGGNPVEIACAYHAGPNNVKRWIMNYAADREGLLLSEIPMDDTRYYAGKVVDAYAIYFQHYYPDPV